MLVYIEIARGGELQIEAAMMRQQLQHVIEKPDPGRDLVTALTFDGKPQVDGGLFGGAV
jgi:hypothetical protein